MKTDTQKPIEKIRKASRVVKSVCMIMMAITLFLFLLLLGITIIDSKKIPSIWILMTVLPFVGMAFLMKGLYHLYKLFGHYSKGDIFTTESVAQIRQLGFTFLLAAGVKVLIVLSAIFVPWPCAITSTIRVVFDPSTINNLFNFVDGRFGVIESLSASGILILISWVMDTGRGLREENDLTI